MEIDIKKIIDCVKNDGHHIIEVLDKPKFVKKSKDLGEIFILGKIRGTKRKTIGYNTSRYIIVCTKCNSDIEMYDKPFFPQLNDIDSGRVNYPCGCSENHQHNERQYALKINRKRKGSISVSGFKGKFRGGESRALCKCEVCLHEWDTQAKILLNENGKGCPMCAKYGFKKDKPAWFYVYKYVLYSGEIIYKYGITNRSPKSRSQNTVVAGDVSKTEEMFKINFDVGIDAENLELLVSNIFKNGRGYYKGSSFISGHTETLSESDGILLLEKIKNGEIK
ncbi:hypothetical protein [Aeromonas phage AS-szw]|uniref:CapR homology domain-containing protein n=1 Tax=Aeromonas phage AS-szw TaxID=2026114 RepID=A0A291LEE3_9CAUD|nr:hypothetical protein [Aeromonas phage AS-szw]